MIAAAVAVAWIVLVIIAKPETVVLWSIAGMACVLIGAVIDGALES